MNHINKELNYKTIFIIYLRENIELLRIQSNGLFHLRVFKVLVVVLLSYS